MRFSPQAIAALLIGAAVSAALASPALAQTCACPSAEGVAVSGPVIQAPEPPPPLPEYDQPPMPASGYAWTPGYWAWNNIDYYWVPGAWVEPPRAGVLWTPPYWAFVGGIFMFRPGYWAPHVGYYGGVNYGFGYGGTGYMGGRWENDRFFYNRAVNNFGSISVANVYNEPITVNNATINRVSYNGGPGGLRLRPTPEQEQVAAEPQLAATPAQIAQVRAASVSADQFRSDNKGKPAVAATPHPGELKGSGVVPARAAGAEGASSKGEERPAPKAEPNAEGGTLPGMKPAAAQPASGERPTGSEPSKGGEKRPAETGPGGRPKPAEAERPIQRTPQPKAAEKPQGAEKPKAPEKPQGMAKPGEMEKPRGHMTPPAAAKPQTPRAGGAERRTKPEAGARACGRPGLPPCRR